MSMPLMILLFSVQMAEPAWMYSESEIYVPLREGQVAVNGMGEIFILDAKECQIIKLDAQGNEVKRFGKKGQGPGEFQFPSHLQTFKDKIYLMDIVSKNLMCFDHNGEFQESWKTTSNPGEILKTEAGFVMGEWSFRMGNNPSGGTVKAYDGQVKNPVIWHDFSTGEEEEQPDGFRLEMKDGKATIPFNPATDRLQLAGLPGGKYVALAHPGPQFKVDIFDAVTGKVLRTVEETTTPLPFNKDWADRLLEKRNKASENSSNAGSIKVHLEANYPEFFPFVRAIAGHGDGRFYLQPWTSQPDKISQIVSFSEKGDVKKVDLTAEVFSRLLYLDEDFGIVGVFDSEEEQAGLAKVPRAQLAGFVKSNPVIHSEQTGFVIMAN